MANKLKSRSTGLLKKVLCADNGIDKRHYALPDVANAFRRDAESLNQGFEATAPALAGEALDKALKKAGRTAQAIDALLICTCTGYLCPGVSSYVAEHMGMRNNVYLQDLVGLGCGAAIPLLRSAEGLAAANRELLIACVAVEICSAAFYLDDDPGVLISFCLFGDGAAATLWSGTPGNSRLRCGNFNTVHIPEDRELLRFVNAEGKLRNKLHRTVPAKAAKAVKHLFDHDQNEPVEAVIAHAGGRDVLDAIEAEIPGIPPLQDSRAILRDYGNMSSPSVLFALERYLDRQAPESDLWLTSFGAGFACHSCRIKPV